MQIPTKKLRSGFEISSLAFGTWEMGGRKERETDYDPTTDIKAIRYAVEQGITRIDTAEAYADGYAEEILGQALQGLNREKLFIQSKVQETHLSYDDILKSCEASLQRLGMDYLDLYIVHKPSTTIPVIDTCKALDKLIADGLVRNVAISNASVSTMKAYQDVLQNKLILNQVHYNLIFREPQIAGVIDYCQSNDIFIEAWRPVQQGSLTHPGITILDEIAEEYDATQAQIAIAWLLAQENVITLFKASQLEHIDDSLKAVEIKLSDADVDRLAKDFPIQLNRSNAVQLI